MKRTVGTVAAAVIVGGLAVLLPQVTRPGRSLVDVIPAGPVLYIEAKDFAALVKEWNASGEKKSWLASANYKVFANSRLFLRFAEAQTQFAAAAGLTPDMTLVDATAGTNSALALYDIGNLEFLYVTRMPTARAYQTMLWQSRAKFQPRQSAGIDYFVRREQNRLTAFAVTNDLLLIATEEQAMASALALMAGQSRPAMKQESWYQRATLAQPDAGDLRMVLNFDRVAATPYFRSYWIQRNTSQLTQFDAAISDLDRAASECRERRMLLRSASSADLRPAEAAAGEISRFAPPDAGLVRVWAAPDTAAVLALFEQKMIAPSSGTEERYQHAPVAGNADAILGSEEDLETRIDQPPLVDDAGKVDLQPLRTLLENNPARAMLQVETSRTSADGVFVTTPRALALISDRPWDTAAVRSVLDAIVARLWSASGAVSALGRLQVAAAGRVVIIATTDDLAATMAARTAASPMFAGAQYAMRFLHMRELARFERMMTLIDYPARSAAEGDAREPLFFSENIASLGRTLGRIDSAFLESHDEGAAVRQRVVYKLR